MAPARILFTPPIGSEPIGFGGVMDFFGGVISHSGGLCMCLNVADLPF